MKGGRMLLCLILLLLAGGILISGRNCDKPFVRAHRKEIGIPLGFACAGWKGLRTLRKLMNRDLLLRRFTADSRHGKLLLLEEDAEKIRDIRTGGAALLILFAGSLTGVLYGAFAGDGSVQALKRPPYGQERLFELRVSGLPETEKIRIPVSGKLPDTEELQGYLEDAYEAEKQVWLGENTDFSGVRTGLHFRSENESGVSFRIRSLEPEYMNDRGMILLEEIPEEGIPVSFLITVSLAEKEIEKQLDVRLFPASETELTEEEKLRKLISEINTGTQDQEELLLPSEMGGGKIVFRRSTVSPSVIAALILLLAGCILYLPRQREGEALKKREELLERAYPDIVSRLTLLIASGFSIRTAFEKTACDHEKRKEMGRKKNRDKGRERRLLRKKEVPDYAYEEMLRTVRAMRSGTGEAEAYADFGKRCGSHDYIRLGSLLSENLRQGISGLQKVLRDEMQESLNRRKNRQLRTGEKAGTKLLFPMLLMLLTVLLILTAPALMVM